MATTLLKEGNLRLFPLAPEHGEIFIGLLNIPAISQRLNEPFPFTQELFDARVDQIRNSHSHHIWMIEDNKVTCGVINAAAGRHPNLWQSGYWVHPQHWNHGIASASLLLVRKFLFRECNAERLQAVVEPDNLASIRVLEKCGYMREGMLHKFYPSLDRGLIDVLMYAYVR